MPKAPKAATTKTTEDSGGKTSRADLKIRAKEVIISYPHLETAQAAEDGGKPKFSAAFVFQKGNASLVELKKKCIIVAKEKFGDKATKMIQGGKLKMPWHDSDEAEKGYPEGSTYVNARSDRKPGVVSIYPDKKNPKKPAVIENVEEEVYAGAIVNATLMPFYYKKSGNEGIGVALNNVQKVRDGDRLDSRVAAADEFDVDESAASTLDDLENEEALEDEEDVEEDETSDDEDDIEELLK
jgi:hypothetical protein